MRVVLYAFRPHYGGAARSDVEFTRRLGEYVDVAVVDPDGHCAAYANAVKAARIDYHVLWPEARSTVIGGKGESRPYRLWRILRALPNLYRVRARTAAVLSELKPSVIFTSSFKSAAMVALSPALRHVPLVLHLRGWYTPDMVPSYAKWLCRQRCAAIFAVSHATRTALRCSGIDPRIIHVLHNPIDLEQTLAQAERPLEAPLPQADRPVRILLPAGIMKTKGQHTAIQAMGRILAAGHDAVLWLAGDFQALGQNRPYLERTKALAERVGVAERVEWLGLRPDMPQVMNAATIIILPTYTEGHARVTTEALALAKPLAATPVGGNLDMILPEVTGLFFEVEDDEGLARCVDRFVSDPEAAAQMGRQGQDYIRRCFRVEDQTRQALEVFRRITGSAVSAGAAHPRAFPASPRQPAGLVRQSEERG